YTYTIDRTLTPFLHPLPTLLALPAFSNIDRVAVGAFIFRPPYPPKPTLLLLRRSPTEAAFPLLWEVPGGGAELPPTDLTLLDSVAREVLEETGLVVTRIAGLVRGPNGEEWIDFRGSTGRRWRKFSFFVEVEGGSEDRELKVVVDKNEHGEWKWVRREEIEGL
ncbi:NUDIX hydrolase domain-like protein, partial [Kalaharituber pfeilii]